eukprot:m.54933 g.54933  ORF g.54933 m.54933 type:complete len:92 (-) comp9226_c0_seq1:1735-2010(-)
MVLVGRAKLMVLRGVGASVFSASVGTGWGNPPTVPGSDTDLGFCRTILPMSVLGSFGVTSPQKDEVATNAAMAQNIAQMPTWRTFILRRTS